MKRETTIGRRASEETPVYLRQEIEKRIGAARKAFDGTGREHIAALQSLNDYLTSVRVEDPRLVALSMIHRRMGFEYFEPTGLQASLLARIGQGFTPDPDITVSELVSAGLEDLAEHLQAKAANAIQAQEAAEEKMRQLRKPVDEAEQTEKELREAREQIDGLNGELTEAKGRAAYLSEFLDRDAPTPKPKKPPRRTRVEDHTGVYFNETAEGKVYEIGYPDEDGKQRWKTVGTDLDEAVALRKELTEGVPA